MMPPEAATVAFLNRLLATLADIPEDKRVHFGAIARALKVSATEVTVGVYQLVNAGRLDRETLRPPPRLAAPRAYCSHPTACAAPRRGACPHRCGRPLAEAAQPQRRPAREPARPEQPVRPGAQVWCGQCDRRVALAKAVNCQSRWCSAELPPPMRECKI